MSVLQKPILARSQSFKAQDPSIVWLQSSPTEANYLYSANLIRFLPQISNSCPSESWRALAVDARVLLCARSTAHRLLKSSLRWQKTCLWVQGRVKSSKPHKNHRNCKSLLPTTPSNLSNRVLIVYGSEAHCKCAQKSSRKCASLAKFLESSETLTSACKMMIVFFTWTVLKST